MLLRRRPPQIDTRPVRAAQGFEHLTAESIAVLKWLKANQVEFVLVGPVAEAIRAGAAGRGPVAIVPAPYRRNFERLWRALDRIPRVTWEPSSGALRVVAGDRAGGLGELLRQSPWVYVACAILLASPSFRPWMPAAILLALSAR